MIHFLKRRERVCSGATRRELLQVGAASFLGLSLPQFLQAQEQGLADADNDVSCIMLFLWGGPPQLDTFDLKPDAPKEIRGEFKPIATSVPGIQVSELLPRLAGMQNRFAIVRSATHNDTEHPRAAHYMMTGNPIVRGSEWPNAGAVVAKFAAGRQNPIGSVVVGPRLIDQPITPQGQDGGFLGNGYAPFRVSDPTLPLDQIAALSPQVPLKEHRANRRRDLKQTVDDFQRSLQSDQTDVLDASYRKAFDLVTNAKTRAAFDLSKESAATREAYGSYAFGQGALMARRLVEAGVRFVQVNWREHPINNYGFDNHGDNFNKLKTQQCPQLDQTVSALLSDLHDRGMLGRTLVFLTGEFGRTPTINRAAGRDHWPYVFSYLIAGAGIAGGQVIGASDQFAAYPHDAPVTPEDTLTSIYRLVGLDIAQLRRQRILEPEAEGIPGIG